MPQTVERLADFRIHVLRHRRRGDAGSRSDEKLIPVGVAEPRQGMARSRLAQGEALGCTRNRARP